MPEVVVVPQSPKISKTMPAHRSAFYSVANYVQFPSYSWLVVGSHAQGEYSVVCSDSMSSAVSSKSYTAAFSSILECVTDLGSGTNSYRNH